MGRLSLDPRKHLDPIGAICMVLLRIGWAKPVPINPYNFRHRDRDIILVIIAGICTNLILFLVSTCLYVLSFKSGAGFMNYFRQFLLYMISFNISLAVFNLLPVPPLDGYHVLNDLLLRRTNLFAREKTVRICNGILLLLIFTGALGEGLVWVEEYVLKRMGNLAEIAMRAAGLML